MRRAGVIATAKTDGPAHAHLELWRTLARGYVFENLLDPVPFVATDSRRFASAPIARQHATPPPPVDPGAGASRADARWMAIGARRAGLPPELPVMASLVETGLRDLPVTDGEAGDFLLRLSIWNSGAYRCFPGDPRLQLWWFLDRTLAIRARHRRAGDRGFGTRPAEYGEWAADVQRSPEQFRGRFQTRLPEARRLIGRS